MYRILITCFEVALAAIVIIPVFLIMGKTLFHNRKKTIYYIVFALYLAAVYHLVGLPCIQYLQLDLSVHLIPFVGMISDWKNSILNIFLFVPLGIFLPLLFEKFRSMKRTVLFGTCMTFLIELLQIFTFRATDINDIATNIIGTCLGYLIASIISKKAPQIMITDKTNYEVFVVCGIVFAIMFFIQPFISGFFWNFIL